MRKLSFPHFSGGRRLVVTILIVLVLTVLTGTVFWGGDPFEKSQPTLPLEKITIANIGVFSVYNPIAREKNMFAANGLLANIDEYDSGATSITALLEGKADVAIAADFVGVRNMFTNRELRVVAQVSEHDVFRLIARRDKGITTPADLKGKSIGLTKKTAGEFYLGRFLIANHLRLGDVQTVDLPPTEMVTRLKNGQIDAVLIFEPHAYTIQQDLGPAVITWSAQGDQRALGFVYALQPFVERHPELIDAYVRTLYQAERYVRENETEARELATKLLGYEETYMDYLWPKFKFGATLSQDLLLNMEEQSGWIIGNGLTDQTHVPNYLDFIYFDALEKVNPAAVSIIH